LIAFERIKFCKVDGGRISWIYRENQLMPFLNVDRTSLLNWANLYFLPGDEELARPAPPPAPSQSMGCSSC